VLSVAPTDMVRVVESALDAVRHAAELKGVRLERALDSATTLVGDADRLQQVVWNLLSNAIKFTPKGGRVQALLRRAESYVEFAVADEGQGIDPSFLPHVFERFRQADGTISRKTGGLGLGLAIVRSVVELHGGTVTAQSPGLELGSTFIVRIPTAGVSFDKVEPIPSGELATARAASFERPPSLTGLRVLVVDDENEVRDLLQYVLEQCGCVVSLANGAEGAFDALGRGTYDVLISDIGMPENDGYGLIRRIRERPDDAHRIAAIALTGYARGEDRAAALRAGFDVHLTKPAQPDELVAAIATLVQRPEAG
jgi:CheY-like chemotaxis protein